MKWLRWSFAGLLFVLGVVVGGVSLLFFHAGEIYDFQDTMDGVVLPRVDAIVVLAGGRGRIAAAGDLWYRYVEVQERGPATPIPKLYISGAGPRTKLQTLAPQMRRGVFKQLKESDVVIEDRSRDTIENATVFAEEAKKRGWKSAILLTSPYHMRRSRLIFASILKREHMTVALETMSIVQEPFDSSEWMNSTQGVRVTMLEYLKWIYAKNFWTP